MPGERWMRLSSIGRLAMTRDEALTVRLVVLLSILAALIYSARMG